MSLVLASDGLAKHPDGIISKPCIALLQTAAICITTLDVATFAIITDADAWGTLFQQQTSAQGGFTIGLVAGTVTVPRTMTVRVTYNLSGVTVINGATRQFAVFGGTGSTNKGGDSFGADLTAGPTTYSGSTLFTCVAGDVISLKGIGSSATFTMAALGGTLLIEEV